MLAPNDQVTFVEPREEDVTEVNRPDAIVYFLEADGVGCERVTDEEQASFEPERAGVRDALHEEVPGILDGRQSGIVRAGRRLIARRGRRPAQVFVRSFLVVLGTKPIEGRCCATSVARGGRMASALSVLCIHSCAPFCCGWPGRIRWC